MSSLHQDHLLTEGTEPVPGTASTARSARTPSRRTADPATAVASDVPVQRRAKARSAAPAATRSAAPRTPGASPRTARSAAVKAAAVAVTGARSATAKAATTKAATVKAAAAAKAAASTTVASRLAARTAAKAAPAKATVRKAPPAKAAVKKAAPAKAAVKKAAPTKAAPAQPAVTKAASAKAAPATAATVLPARRPTPYPRDVSHGALSGGADAVPPAPSARVQGPVSDAGALVAAVALGDPSARPLARSQRRRSALYLAAALIAATSFGTVTAGGPQAVAATPVAHSVSIAHELGIDRRPDTVTAADAQHLRQLAASRNQRGAQEVAAAQVQAAADRRATEAARPKAVLPVAGARLTSTFGMRWGTLHAGIDLAAPLGTPEYAAMDGVVLRAGPASGFGLAVYIQHANGDVTVYGHMEKILVTEGQVVRAGETIALLGAMGQATGPHLHLEVHVGGMLGTKIDPLPWLRERGVAI